MTCFRDTSIIDDQDGDVASMDWSTLPGYPATRPNYLQIETLFNASHEDETNKRLLAQLDKIEEQYASRADKEDMSGRTVKTPSVHDLTVRNDTDQNDAKGCLEKYTQSKNNMRHRFISESCRNVEVATAHKNNCGIGLALDRVETKLMTKDVLHTRSAAQNTEPSYAAVPPVIPSMGWPSTSTSFPSTYAVSPPVATTAASYAMAPPSSEGDQKVASRVAVWSMAASVITTLWHLGR